MVGSYKSKDDGAWQIYRKRRGIRRELLLGKVERERWRDGKWKFQKNQEREEDGGKIVIEKGR